MRTPWCSRGACSTAASLAERPAGRISDMTERTEPAAKTPKSPEESRQKQTAEEQFVRGVLVRGEAAKPEQGELPPDATHEIVEEREGELPKIRRRRYSLR